MADAIIRIFYKSKSTFFLLGVLFPLLQNPALSQELAWENFSAKPGMSEEAVRRLLMRHGDVRETNRTSRSTSLYASPRSEFVSLCDGRVVSSSLNIGQGLTVLVRELERIATRFGVPEILSSAKDTPTGYVVQLEFSWRDGSDRLSVRALEGADFEPAVLRSVRRTSIQC